MTVVSAVVAVVALLLAAWVRAAGSAVSRVPRADAHHDAAEGRRGARTLASLLDDRPKMTFSVGVVGSGLLVVAAVASVLAVGSGAGLAAIVVTGVGIVLFGDVLPRLLGVTQPEPIAYNSSFLLALAVRLGGWATEGPIEENGNGPEDGEEEDDEHQLTLISSVLRFSETIVREVMVPRPDMVTVDADTEAAEVAAAAIESGFSRFPVAQDDDIVGILLVKDLLPALTRSDSEPESDQVTAATVMRPAVFVPEVKPIDELLTEMRANKTHMAIVADEFGDIAGLVTIEDLLEELVGEIADETDEEEVWVEPLREGVWRVDARLSVEALAELLGAEFPEGDWDTVGGLVLGLAERVPEEDERFEVDSTLLEVTRMQGRRVAEVVVTASSTGEQET